MIGPHERLELTVEHGFVRAVIGGRIVYEGDLGMIGTDNVVRSLASVLDAILRSSVGEEGRRK